MNAPPCYYCQQPSTHQCTACGHLLCDSPICAALAARDVANQRIVQPVVRHVVKPVARFVSNLPSHLPNFRRPL